MKAARLWNMGSRNRFSVEASLGRASSPLPQAFNREPFVVNVSDDFERRVTSFCRRIPERAPFPGVMEG